MTAESICNQAMGWLGANPVVGLITDPVSSTDTVETRLCKENFGPLRNAVLEETVWSFAKFFAELDTTETVSNWQWGRVASLAGLSPIQLRVIQAKSTPESDDNSAMWEMGDNAIFCDVEKIYITYVGLVTDVSKFSPTFEQALAHRIAADLAIPLTESRSLQETHWGLYGLKKELAEAVDGMQGRGQEHVARRYDRRRWGGAQVS